MLCRTAMMAMLAGFDQPDRPDSVGYIDHDTLPIRCHWASDAYQQKCDLLITSAGESWARQVDEIGFEAPVMDQDGILDIYLYNYPSGGAYTYCSTWEDDDSTDDLTGCPAYIALDYRISEDELASYMAHEFNHVLQYATDYNEPTLPIWEATATAAEQWTYPDALVPTLYYINDYQAVPWLGLLSDGYFLWHEKDIWSTYEYGAAAWILHLDHHYGDGYGSAGAAIWRALAQGGSNNAIDVLDGYDTVTGDWRDAYLSMSAERVRIGTSNPPVWLDYGNQRSRIAFDGEYGAADLPVTHTPTMPPFGTGAVYVRLTESVDADGITVTVAGDEGTWGIVAVSQENILWETGTRLEWPHSGPAVFGVVNLDHDPVAQSGRENHLLDSRRDVTITLTPYTVDEPSDSGDPGIDDRTPPDEPSEPGKTRSCSSAPSGPPLSLPLLLLWVPLLLCRRR
jgi:hypothetical protein